MPRKKSPNWPYLPYGNPVAGREYLAVVLSVDRAGDEGIIRLKHLDGDQVGRTVELRLPLPIRPEGLGADFCRACGLIVDPQQGVDPTRAVEKVLRVVFGPSPNGELQVASLKPGKQDVPS